MRRIVIPELLDDDLGTAAEIAQTLTDLRHINQWFGGMRTTSELLRRVARATGCRKLSILEVGAGAGDVPLAAQRVLAGYGIGLQVTLLDRIWSHLPRDGAASVAGDALHLPFRNEAFDVVSCSLLAHHFEPEALVEFASGIPARLPAGSVDQRSHPQPAASASGLSWLAALPQPHHLA